MRLRRIPATTLVLAVVLLSGCDGATDVDPETPVDTGITSGGEPADPRSDQPEPEASFRVEVTPDDTAVSIRYRLTNGSDRVLLVPNQLTDSNGAVDDTRQTVYVTGTGEHAVAISQRVFASPETDRLDLAQLPTVGVSRLKPGGILSVDLEVPLPLERRHPFGDDLGYGTIELPDPVDEVQFCLGVISAPVAPNVGLVRSDGVSTIQHGTPANDAQYLYCSDPVDL